MKKIYLLCGFLAIAGATSAQRVGIGTVTPDTSAQLDVNSSNRGFLPPRMTSAERDAIIRPAIGLMVYNISLTCLQMNTGTPLLPIWQCLLGGGATNNAAILAEILEGSASTGGASNANGVLVTAAQLNQVATTGGAIAGNEPAYNQAILKTTSFSNPPTPAQVQAVIDGVNSLLATIGADADNTGTTTSVTAAQLGTIASGVVPSNELAYQHYIDANPNSFSAPATAAEVQAMINTVNANVTSVLAQIGNEGDLPNVVPSVVTASQLNFLPVTGVVPANEIAYQHYIDANPNSFSSPATVAEVQAMITAVNANVASILAQVGNEGDSPNTVPSVVTAAQLGQLPVNGVDTANQLAYQHYIDVNPNSFSSPATVAEVQAMVTAVNAAVTSILAQIGNEGDSPNVVPSVVTAAQLNQLPVTGVVAANQLAYQHYIDANPNSFSSPATVAEVQAMITAVNANVTSILAQVGNEGDSPNTVPSVVTAAQLGQLPVTGVDTGNQLAYQHYIDANPNSFSSPATVTEVQAMVTAVNAAVTSILAQIGNEGDSPNVVPSVVTAAQLNQLPVTGVVAANELGYQHYIDANPNSFSSPATVAEVQAMITAVNAAVTSVLAQIGNEGDSPNVVPSVITIAQLNSLPVTGVVPADSALYRNYIDTNPNSFSSPATVAEVQAMITAVNASMTSILAQIGNEGDSPNAVPSVVTAAQLNQLPVTGVVAANELAYQHYIDANPNSFSSPATVAEVQAMVTAVNAAVTSILAQIGNEGDSPNVVPSVVTAAQLNQLPVTGVVSANELAYQHYIDANPNSFSSPATVAEVQAMITAVNAAVNAVLVQIGNEGDSPDVVPSVVTIAQLSSLPVTGVIPADSAFYRAYIDANPNSFSSPATVAEVQAMVTAVNAAVLTSGGTGLVAAYSCSTASAGTLTAGTAASGVTQTITATVTTVGTYNITSTANGITFSASGTFAGTGVQNIVLTASGTPATAGNSSFTLSTTPGCSFSRTVNAAAPTPLPANITLSAAGPYFIASVYDQDYAPYTPPTGPATLATAQAADGTNEAVAIDMQGTLTIAGVTVKIPYTVVTASVNLPAISQTITVPASATQDGISRDMTFSYAAQTLAVGSGNITATLKSVGGTLNVKKLDVQTGIGNDNLGYLLGQFTFATNSSNGTSNFAVRAIAGMPDRNFADASHRMLYVPVTGADGNVWLNNNLGADYANTANAAFNPAQQASSVTDYHAYGSLFQWGRFSDGHELITWTGSLAGTPVNGITSTPSTTDMPVNSLWIVNNIGAADWRTPQNDALWQGAAGTNNPCPIGFRVPTKTEITTLAAAAGITDDVTALNSTLKITSLQTRPANSGIINFTNAGQYWTSTYSSTNAPIQAYLSWGNTFSPFVRSAGAGVRCIKDNTPAATLGAINCSGATTTGTLAAGNAATGVSSSIPYTGGNGGVQYGQTVSSTGVTGLTATLAAGTFASGAGNLTYTISGTPAAAGTASFAISVGGQSCTLSVTVAATAPLPGNITLSSISPYFIASAFDQDYAPYTAPTVPATLATGQAADGANEAAAIDIQGTLTTTGVTINIPYTVVTASVSLPAFSQTITVPAAATQDGISRDITFSYAAQTLAVGSGNIAATLKSVGGTLNVKKLDVQTGIGNDYLGYLLGQFTFATNSSNGTSNFAVRAIPGMPDRNFADASHRMLYVPITAADGNVWLNNNLGADYANTAKASFNPAQQASGATDYKAYGSLYQWGRYSDGHELINWTSGTAGTPVNGTTTTLSATDNPGNSLFIIPGGSPYDWRSTKNDNLWQGVTGINNPCPIGYRLPTSTELSTLVTASNITDLASAGSSAMKITSPGWRYINGTVDVPGTSLFLCTSTVSGVNYIYYNGVGMPANNRFVGSTVRCIKD